ncbi:MAG: hypothetical protein OK422_01610 [Thaumarchaeota archaeon]|nr:hypothetical protein [Nitrososphaerota archaeon]
MAEDKSLALEASRLNEAFVEHIEVGGRKVRTMALVTTAVASFLLLSYVIQLVLPFALGTTTVTVNLVDPTLVIFEVVLIVFTILWLFVGLRDYFFMTRISKQIKEIRAQEAEIGKRIKG